MNADPVLIVDDDVDMEPVVILDEDDENVDNDNTVRVASAAAVETIDLDDEATTVTEDEAFRNNAATVNKKSEVSYIHKPTPFSEDSFVNNLKNNRLMDKIVSKVTSMENATGMNRVVNRTLLPLYRDANNRFKESEGFRELLKRTYKLLARDPDHKFLHIKTLCEELKSGGLRRKVPFVTLATNMRNNGSRWEPGELTSSSREIKHNNTENRQIHKVKRPYKRKRVGGPRTKRKCNQAKDRVKTRSIANAERRDMTDIIDLDVSETESVVIDSPKSDDDENEVIVIEETEPREPRNYNNQNTVKIEEDSRLEETLEEDSRQEETLEEDSRLEETLEEDSRQEETLEENSRPQKTLEENSRLQETFEKDSNKENNDKNGQSSENEMDYELLIPKIVCNVSNGSNPIDKKYKLIDSFEKRIAFNKKMIDKLEQEEVLIANPQSPYYVCSKYKEDIVYCYKRICEMIGESKELVKRREIRLRVAEGHPSGPAKRLEQFMNSTIDVTGAVEFPDFSDVVKCVLESNQCGDLGWSKHEVMQEAVALFRQCGQALRKQRQKREYRDLLSLVPDTEEIDDPAEKDPVLLAKLEDNKLIAKIKEEEILDRYVRMENNALLARIGIPQVQGAAEFESDKDSSDSENDQNTTIPNNITTSTVIKQPVIGECSRSNTGLSLLPNNSIVSSASSVTLSLLQTNNTIGSSAPINNLFYVTQSSNPNNVVVNNFVGTSTATPITQNPMLMNILIMPAAPIYFVQNKSTNQNQCAIRESSTTNDAISNNRLDVLATNDGSSTPNTIHNECEEDECSDKEDIIKSDLTISETVVGFNTDTINRNSEISSMKNIENTEQLVKNKPCNVTDVPNNISSTTDGVEQNCDSSVISEDVKTETVVKTEPLDIQSMLDELGDGFVCQVFDVEDPFLVIEISSDGYSDDDVL